MKTVDLKWYVLRHDFNSDKIVPYNILYKGFDKFIKDEIKKEKIKDKAGLIKRLYREFHHSYWCKSECEILVSGLFTKQEPTKIDIWTQIEPNLDSIADYLIYKLNLFKTK